MKSGILTLAVVSIIALSLVWTQSISASTQQPEIDDGDGATVQKNAYYVMLKDEYFSSVDNDPKFADKDQLKASNIPEKNAKVIPELQHEYEMKIGALMYKKIAQYNGTLTSSLSPLTIQGGYVDTVMIHAIRGFEIRDVPDISYLLNDPDIATVEPIEFLKPQVQYATYNGMRLGQYVNTVSPFRPNYIEAPTTNVDIAVVDFAIFRTHPDLNVAGTSTFCVFYTGSNCYPPPHNHGTLVGGIAAARDNLAGVVGAAPGARLWSVAICGGSGTSVGCSGSMISALNYITANAATFEVATMSVAANCVPLDDDCGGMVTDSPTVSAFNAAVNAGVTITVAAGNEGINSDHAFCDVASVICVSALADMDGKCGGLANSFGPFSFGGQSRTQKDDQRAYFSNFGPDVDIMASGTNLFEGGTLSTSTQVPSPSSVNSIFFFIGASTFGSYGAFGGTSEATPWVGGAAAALKSLHPSWTPAQVKADLQTNAIAQNAACNTSTGIGGLKNNPNSGSSEKILNLAAID